MSKKVACIDCEHMSYLTTMCDILEERFHPIRGLEETPLDCEYKNQHCHCADFQERKPNVKKNRQTEEKTCSREKTWRNAWGLLHK